MTKDFLRRGYLLFIQVNKKNKSKNMKKKWIILFAFATSFVVTAFKIADDIISRLGMQEQTARWHIVNNLVGRFSTGPMEPGMEVGQQSFQIPRARLLADIIKGDKAAAAKELCEYVKKYVSSEEFIIDYNKQKESAMPLTDKGMSLSGLERDREVIKKNIKNYPNDTKYVAEQQKLLDETEKRITALKEAAKKPFPGKEVWEKTYPADPGVIIKKRLQEYLQLVTTVDFNATLTAPDKYNVKKFTNPVYEKKSLKWKAIYRAGQEVNDAVTVFVKEWLKGDIIKK